MNVSGSCCARNWASTRARRSRTPTPSSSPSSRQGLTNLAATFNPRCRKVGGPCFRHRISPHRLEDDMGTDMATIDEEQVAELLGRFVNDLGATISAGNVLIGDKLGLYQTLAEAGPLTPSELAAYTSTAERYVREWLPGQAAGGYISYDAESGRYSMTEAQALALADPAGWCYRGVPACGGVPVRRVDDPGRVQDWRRGGLGRASPGRLHRLRAILPARLCRELGELMDPGGRRSSGAPGRGHPCRRCRLRAGSVDPHPGRHLSGLVRLRVRPTPGVDRACPEGGRGGGPG